jgi:hypothetical protein
VPAESIAVKTSEKSVHQQSARTSSEKTFSSTSGLAAVATVWAMPFAVVRFLGPGVGGRFFCEDGVLGEAFLVLLLIGVFLVLLLTGVILVEALAGVARLLGVAFLVELLGALRFVPDLAGVVALTFLSGVAAAVATLRLRISGIVV